MRCLLVAYAICSGFLNASSSFQNYVRLIYIERPSSKYWCFLFFYVLRKFTQTSDFLRWSNWQLCTIPYDKACTITILSGVPLFLCFSFLLILLKKSYPASAFLLNNTKSTNLAKRLNVLILEKEVNSRSRRSLEKKNLMFFSSQMISVLRALAAMLAVKKKLFWIS